MTFTDFSGKLYLVSERKTMKDITKNMMSMAEIRKFMANKRKREENLKRIGKAAEIAVVRQRMPNIV